MKRLEATHYQELAAKARVAAERTPDDMLRAQFLQLALTYDQLAEQLDRSRAGRSNPDARGSSFTLSEGDAPTDNPDGCRAR